MKSPFNVVPQHDFLNSPGLNKPVNLEIKTIKSRIYTYIRYDNVKYYTRKKINIMGMSCRGKYFTIKERIRKRLDKQSNLSSFKEISFTKKDAKKYFYLRDGIGQNDCWHFYEYNQNQLNDLIHLINQITNIING